MGNVICMQVQWSENTYVKAKSMCFFMCIILPINFNLHFVVVKNHVQVTSLFSLVTRVVNIAKASSKRYEIHKGTRSHNCRSTQER